MVKLTAKQLYKKWDNAKTCVLEKSRKQKSTDGGLFVPLNNEKSVIKIIGETNSNVAKIPGMVTSRSLILNQLVELEDSSFSETSNMV